MLIWMPVLFILAADEQQRQVDPLTPLLFPMLAIAFLWYFLLFRPQKREQQRRDTMLAALKKNDRVVTIGGIIGTVANISSDGKEVTLKVDDNTRIKMLRSSIQGLLVDEEDEPQRGS